jgi:hypothetical protein
MKKGIWREGNGMKGYETGEWGAIQMWKIMKKITFYKSCSIYNKLQINQEQQVLQERNFKGNRRG